MKLDDRIEKIRETLAHAPHEATAEKLARSVNLSVSRLRHLIKLEMGVPLARLIRAQQMEAVRSLLVGSFLSVKQIMRETGFANADETSFIRGFRRIVGVTPGEFRRRARAAQRRGLSKINLRKAA